MEPTCSESNTVLREAAGSCEQEQIGRVGQRWLVFRAHLGTRFWMSTGGVLGAPLGVLALFSGFSRSNEHYYFQLIS
jgi:hypothetical protein